MSLRRKADKEKRRRRERQRCAGMFKLQLKQLPLTHYDIMMISQVE